VSCYGTASRPSTKCEVLFAVGAGTCERQLLGGFVISYSGGSGSVIVGEGAVGMWLITLPVRKDDSGLPK